MQTKRIEFTTDEFEFVFDQISKLNEQLHREVKLNPKAARSPGATNMIQLHLKLVERQKTSATAPAALGLSRHELRLLQRILHTTKDRLLNAVIPNYEEAAPVRGPEIAEKYRAQVVKLKGLVYNVLTPLIEKVEGKL